MAPAPQPAGAVKWEIGGDAACESRRKGGGLEGLGAFFYGTWWNVPLDSIEGLRGLHITCLELIELGLGVVIAGPWVARARCVRLVSDALAAVLALRAWREDGRRARDARASALIAVHEVIMARPEWIALQEPEPRTEVAQHYGEGLLLYDAASRQHTAVIRDVCRALEIEPRQLDPLPERTRDYLREAIAAARAADVDRAAPVHEQSSSEVIKFMAEFVSALLDGTAGVGELLAAAAEVPVGELGDGQGIRPCKRQALPKAIGGSSTGDVELAMSGGRPESGVLSGLVTKPSLGVALLAPPKASSERPVGVAGVAMALGSASGSGGSVAAKALSRVTAERRWASSEPIRDAARAAIQGGLTAAVVARKVQEPSDGLEELRGMLVERAVQSAKSNEDGLGVKGDVDDLLRGLLAAAQKALERRFAQGTRRLDRSYWRFWKEWCLMLGTPPLRLNEAANSGAIAHLHQREVAIALGAFMAWVAENPQFKVESMLARLRGVARKHRGVGIKFVSLATVVQAAEGLIQEHIDAHGAETLLPKSKEPFASIDEIMELLNLPEGTTVGSGADRVIVGDNVAWQGVVVRIHLYCTMGPRKEAMATGEGEVFGPRKLSLWHVTYNFGGQLVRAPTVRQLLDGATRGTVVYITPCPCKNDPRGTKYANSPVPSAYDPHRKICFAREVIKYELMRRVDPERRRQEPLVLGPRGRSWTKRELDAFARSLFELALGTERGRKLTVHSFRV